MAFNFSARHPSTAVPVTPAATPAASLSHAPTTLSPRTVGPVSAPAVSPAASLSSAPTVLSPVTAGPVSAPAGAVGGVPAVPAASWRERYRRRVLVTDLLVVVVAVALAGPLSVLGGVSAERPPLASTTVVTLLWVVMLQLFHTRSARDMAVGALEYRRVLAATAVTAGMVAVVGVLTSGTGARAHLLVAFPAGLAGLVAGRWLWRSWLQRRRRQGCALSDVVVVGHAPDVRYVLRQIERKSGAAYKVVGVVLDGPVTPEDAIQDWGECHRASCYVGLEETEDAVRDLEADAVIVAGPLSGGNRAIRDLAWSLEPARTEIILVPSLTNVAGPRISVRPVEGLPLMHVVPPTFEGGRHLAKRTLDVVVASLALVAMLPLFGALALLITRDSPGSVFFAQTRTGRRGHTFRMYKFRTMVATAEQDRAKLMAANQAAGPLFKMRDDPRVTRIGRFLRRHSLDELPQFWNVLRGEMSLVGPRPPLPSEAATYAGHEGRRLYIKPGLTGLWQVNGRSDLEWDESVRLDLYYVENWSVTGDLTIMWRTFKVMIQPEGAY